jgi:hypothetical protein
MWQVKMSLEGNFFPSVTRRYIDHISAVLRATDLGFRIHFVSWAGLMHLKPVHNGLCPQRKPVINGHFVNNTSFFMVFVWNQTCTQRKLSITSELFPPEQIFVQTNLYTTNFLSIFFCSQGSGSLYRKVILPILVL